MKRFDVTLGGDLRVWIQWAVRGGIGWEGEPGAWIAWVIWKSGDGKAAAVGGVMRWS